MGEGQGEQGCAGGGRVSHRGVREGSEEQSVQDLESDVVGVVLSASGAGGGDTEAAWRRHQDARGSRPSRTGSRRRWWPAVWSEGSSRSSIRTPTATGPGGRRWTRWERAGERCWKSDWVIDLDIRKFFDSVPWDLVVKAVEAHTDAAVGGVVCAAVAGRAAAAARRRPCSSGTGGPRKGPRSRPCWRTCSCTTRSMRGWPGSSRPSGSNAMSDDAVVHCVSERQARQVLAAIGDRMVEVGLELHPDKTRIVYCKDGQRARCPRAHRVHVPGVHVPGARGAEQGRDSCSPRSCPRSAKRP